MLQYPEKEALFKSALRQQILSRSQLIRDELSRGTKFVYSEQYPTQVLNTKLGRYIRINVSDINEDSIYNTLKLMMGIESYYTIPEHTVTNPDGSETVIPEETQNIVEVLDEATKKVKKTDFVDLNLFDPDYIDEDGYSGEEDDVLQYDSFGNITGTNFSLTPQLIHLAPGEETHDEFDPSKLDLLEEDSSIESDSTSSDLTETAKSLDSCSSETSGKTTTEKTTIEYIEQALKDLPQYKNISKFHTETSVLSKKDLEKLQPKVKQLLKAFKGTGDQIKLISPTKRMSSKDVATDRDKCYIKKTGIKGKHIKLNFLIDMSGSMSGNPVKNAVRLVYLFNQLAKEGYVTMSVLYSTTNANYKLDLPASDSEILALCRTQSAEGLAKTIHAHADAIRGINTICLTDGDIVDEA